jgi:hypothetical protein
VALSSRSCPRPQGRKGPLEARGSAGSSLAARTRPENPTPGRPPNEALCGLEVSGRVREWAFWDVWAAGTHNRCAAAFMRNARARLVAMQTRGVRPSRKPRHRPSTRSLPCAMRWFRARNDRQPQRVKKGTRWSLRETPCASTVGSVAPQPATRATWSSTATSGTSARRPGPWHPAQPRRLARQRGGRDDRLRLRRREHGPGRRARLDGAPRAQPAPAVRPLRPRRPGGRQARAGELRQRRHMGVRRG